MNTKRDNLVHIAAFEFKIPEIHNDAFGCYEIKQCHMFVPPHSSASGGIRIDHSRVDSDCLHSAVEYVMPRKPISIDNATVITYIRIPYT